MISQRSIPKLNKYRKNNLNEKSTMHNIVSYKKLLVLAKPKLVARLLASDFACASSLRSCPAENPRTQTRCGAF